MKNLERVFKKYGLSLSGAQCEKFDVYFHHLVETNKYMNLTAITEEDEVVVKHFLDSVLPFELFEKGTKIVDVGSGAGFPAIPLKIFRDDLEVCMLDSLNKRVKFLNDVIEKLNLKNAAAVHGRAEDFAKENREKFDVATARAVASLDTLVEYLLPLVKVGGCAIIYKATKVDQEVVNAQNAIKILGGKLEKIQNFKIDEFEIERNVLVIRKISKTPLKFPRGKNLPKTAPIK